MEIFNQTYYPAVFDNWYIDDWISQVYGKNRTLVLQDWKVKHHVVYIGKSKVAKHTRYRPSMEQANLVNDEIDKGSRIVDKWLSLHGGDSISDGDNATIVK